MIVCIVFVLQYHFTIFHLITIIEATFESRILYICIYIYVISTVHIHSILLIYL